jgi:hypothetical protein
MLVMLGWVQVVNGSGRMNPRNSDIRLQDDGVLWDMYGELKRQQKTAKGFIQFVFQSSDVVWVERCQSIITG